MDGVVIGNESEQKNTQNFNLKTNHVSDEGFIKNITEESKDAEMVSSNNYLSLKKINNFYFAERYNVDSIAFVLFATNIDDDRRIGLTYEFQPSINKSIIKSFTCSIRNPEVKDLKETVKDEVEKQSGFKIDISEIEYLGKSFVSSKSSEFCHLFGVSVDKLRRIKKEPDSSRKKDSGEFWATVDEVKEMEDWKGQLIVFRRFMSKKNQIYIKKKQD